MRTNDTASPSQRVPTLNPEEADHCLRVRAALAHAIAAAGGWLAFEDYMDIALYAPGLGYYSAGARKFGENGDFTTAPETSELFGACVANQCAEILGALGPASILEIGAGTGRLAADVLTRLQALNRLPDRYAILEVSADLRARQRELLLSLPADLNARVEWLDAPPAAIRGVILANEVLDALPVKRFRWEGGGFLELGVECAAGQFRWAARPANTAVERQCRRLAQASGPWVDPYTSEYCARLGPWSAAVTQGLDRGAVFWIDYGLPRAQYYLPERTDGTLLCHFRHRTDADPFRFPGLQDISAWVDFTALAEAGRDAGFAVAGFTTQTYFLAGLGIDRCMQALARGAPQRAAMLAAQARRLTMPGEMGERFKVMAWLRGIDVSLSGFALRDLRHTL
jgi:SAM-dependent MidA family methyltransferase